MKKGGMMNKIGVMLGIMVLVFAGVSIVREYASASVIVGNDYKTREVISTDASATVPVIVKAGTGSFGSLIVASSSTAGGGVFRIYDNALATSTATSTRIAQFPASVAAGTYTFDREIERGIVIDVPVGFNGSYIVTYR